MTRVPQGASRTVARAAGSPASRAPVGTARKSRHLALLGPAFVSAVAYVDPGNFAANFQAGARFRYMLVWVVVAASLMAMFVQYLSAKLGLASGKDLPSLCRERFPRPLVWLLWVQAEMVAMATDLAELLGAAIGLNLLFGTPLFPAAIIAAVVSFAVLALQARGYRPFDAVITFLLGIVAAGFCYQLIAAGHQSVPALAAGMLPEFRGGGSVTLAVGIVGATVMPHVIYLHSAMVATRPQDQAEPGVCLRILRADCVLGLGLAGVINVIMLCVAVVLFSGPRQGFDGSLQAAHASLALTAGGAAALAFAVALFISGLSSSGVGTYAGQVIMQGFIRRRIPLVLRRGLTVAPALAVIASGVSPDTILLMSQVMLSFGIPFALMPLAVLTGRRNVMGPLVNVRLTSWAAVTVAVLISVLNLYLLVRWPLPAHT